MNKLPKDISIRLSNNSMYPTNKFKKELLKTIRKDTTMAQKTNPLAQFFARSPYIGLGVLLTLLVVVGGTSAIASKNRTENAALREIEIPQNLSDVLPIDTVRATALGLAPTNSTISSIELEQEEGQLIYRVRYSDGSVRYFDAKSGNEINKPSNTVEIVPQNFTASITLQQARETAQAVFPTKTIVKIELENENGAVVYSVRFNDDSRVDVNATTGAVTRTKNGSEKENESNNTVSNSDDSSSDSEHSSGSDDKNESGSQSSGSNSGSGSNSHSGSSNSGSGSNSNDD